ncbi:MAG: hypothetical protein SWY16_00135 [Cyanobacteriota bacterium]|nr:hypothetical protein [Cyanobacteriota bacterium]
MRNSQHKDAVETIELSPGIEIHALLPTEHIPAVRAGFALFPANPRWSALKFQAWKSGRRLRQALDRGETNVSDRYLVVVRTERAEEPPTSQSSVETCVSTVKRLLGQRSYAGW